MRIVLYVHSLVSCWNHGNAHFLRGVVRALQQRGHDVRVFEPAAGWSRANLLREHGPAALERFAEAFPDLESTTYDAAHDPAPDVAAAGLVLVHEWNEPALVARLGALRRQGGRFRLLFHDSHHRLATAPEQIQAFDLRGYDGVLAFGKVLTDLYLERGLARRAFTWHEAADVTTFRPLDPEPIDGDLVWVGNWGDGERARELEEFLFRPSRVLALKGTVHGVRYPEEGLAALARSGLAYGGFLRNDLVPRAFARHRFTVHVPRRAYAERLPGIPTIRVFEALACGIPLVSAPWHDAEGLFRPGEDYLVARDGDEMVRHLRALRDDPDLGLRLAGKGLRTILQRHTCGHRAEELLAIAAELGADPAPERPAAVHAAPMGPVAAVQPWPPAPPSQGSHAASEVER